MKKLSVILPTYNEAGNIGQLIKSIAGQRHLKKYRLEFIVVDDDSDDGTANVVRKIKGLSVKLIIRKNQKGLATAILRGFKQAWGDIVVIMDSDFNHQPKDIYCLLQPFVNNRADLVIGSRYIPGGGMHITEATRLQFWLSRWGNYFINRCLFKLPVHESLSGFVAVRRSVLDRLNQKKIFYGYGEYCIRLLYYAHRLGFRLVEVPIMYGLRRYGTSKSSIKRMAYFYSKTVLGLLFSQL